MFLKSVVCLSLAVAASAAEIAAAVTAARAGHSTVLLEPSARVGGLLTGGLSYTDFRTQEAVTGFFREYMNAVLDHYTKTYGKDSAQVTDCFFGALAEPKVSLMILRRMLAAEKNLQVWTGWRLHTLTLESIRRKTSCARLPQTTLVVTSSQTIDTSRLQTGASARALARLWAHSHDSPPCAVLPRYAAGASVVRWPAPRFAPGGEDARVGLHTLPLGQLRRGRCGVTCVRPTCIEILQCGKVRIIEWRIRKNVITPYVPPGSYLLILAGRATNSAGLSRYHTAWSLLERGGLDSVAET
jgi:hypothetical protein